MTFDQLISAAARRAGPPTSTCVPAHPPLVRINGELQPWTAVAPLTAAHLEAICRPDAAARATRQRLQTTLEVDVAWQAPGPCAVRASVFRQRGTVAHRRCA